MSLQRLSWWHAQAVRINDLRKGGDDDG